MATTNKRPLISTATPPPPAIRNHATSLQSTSNQQDHPTSTISQPSLPQFLTLPRPTLLQKFHLVNRHEAQIRANPTAILSHPLALSRNRYPDIHPWSHNRIQLSSLEFPYINASPIDLGREDEKFIATQGPVSEYRTGTLGRVVQGEGGNGVEWSGESSDKSNGNVGGGFGHFWEMVWQEDVEIIVMLTRCIEEGREKCGVYYPNTVDEVLDLESDSSSSENWGSVTCESVCMEWGTEIRELTLSRRKKEVLNSESTSKDDKAVMEEKKVWHFLFLAWPDQDVPQTAADQKALLELIKMTRFRINASILNKSSLQDSLQKQPNTPPSSSPSPSEKHKPRIIHCSAGVGRTGTFIALDHLLQELDEGKLDAVRGEDPIFECVKRLREQRMFMVYKASQFAFIYQVLKEAWVQRIEAGNRDELAQGDLGSPVKKRKLGDREQDPFR